MSKEYNIDLSLGLKTIQINFDAGREPVQIQFNPADDDLPKRLFEAEKQITENLKKIGEIKKDAEGHLDTDDYVKTISEKNKIIFDAVDYAFGNNISDNVFMHCSPTAIVNGQYFIEQFLEKITPVIKKIIEQENKKATVADRKYYSKYTRK